MPNLHTRAIKLALDGDKLPVEFRLFQKGWNDTENGRFLFDDAAAKSVMAAVEAWGVDLAIDLEHAMTEIEPGESPDPTARDARGWCKLELRDGELWAVGVSWTPDGAARLQQKRQRYVSPTFMAHTKTKRVLKMINVAITAMPATHDTPALVAATAHKRVARMKQLERARRLVSLASEMGLDPSLVKQALEAIEKGDAKAALDILKGLVASAAGAEPDADGDEDGSEGDGAEGVSPPAEAESENVEDPKVVDNAAPPAAGDDGDDDDDDDDKPAKKAERKAMRVMLCRLTGKRTFAEAVAEVEIYRASHMTLEIERKQIAKERATLESAERRKLCVDLIKLGAEFPATVWTDEKSTALKPRWQKMPIVELRSHVAEQRKARGTKKPTEIKPPPGEVTGDTAVTLDDGTVVQLSASEVRIAKSQNCEIKTFAALKAYRDSKKG